MISTALAVLFWIFATIGVLCCVASICVIAWVHQHMHRPETDELAEFNREVM